MYTQPNQENMIVDTEHNVKYKIVGKNGEELAVKPSQMLAEMFINGLPEEIKEGARVVPVTDTGKQLLFG